MILADKGFWSIIPLKEPEAPRLALLCLSKKSQMFLTYRLYYLIRCGYLFYNSLLNIKQLQNQSQTKLKKIKIICTIYIMHIYNYIYVYKTVSPLIILSQVIIMQKNISFMSISTIRLLYILITIYSLTN